MTWGYESNLSRRFQSLGFLQCSEGVEQDLSQSLGSPGNKMLNLGYRMMLSVLQTSLLQ